jgi:Tol biopolymer transport system component
MRSDGTNPRLLTTDLPGVHATPEISPDGEWIVFSSNRHAPATFQIRLYVMRVDGSEITRLGFADPADEPGATDVDADPDWGPGNRLVFKRELDLPNPRFSRIMTASIDPATKLISDVEIRTDGTPELFDAGYAPGDYDPKLSPDGSRIVSYRRLSGAPPDPFGRWDMWVGDTDPLVPHSVTFLNADPNVADLLPRWNSNGTRLALWSIDANVFPADGIDIVVVAPDGSGRTNITAGNGLVETMPSWHPTHPDRLVYSARSPLPIPSFSGPFFPSVPALSVGAAALLAGILVFLGVCAFYSQR